MNVPVNNLLVQTAGTNQSGVLAGNGTSPVATATAAQISAALDLLGSVEGSALYRESAAWQTRPLQAQICRIASLRA